MLVFWGMEGTLLKLILLLAGKLGFFSLLDVPGEKSPLGRCPILYMFVREMLGLLFPMLASFGEELD